MAERNENISAASVVVATVTYGDRRHLLTQLIDGCQALGIVRIVIVSNGALWNVPELADVYSDIELDILELPGNKGSAAGFSAAINRAWQTELSYIWLLDDDNCPMESALIKLLEAYGEAVSTTPKDRLALLANREHHQPYSASRMFGSKNRPRFNRFRGFHVLDVPGKLWRRTPWGRIGQEVSGRAPLVVQVENAPYSGLFFSRQLVKCIGLPNESFVLYADDLEYSYRVTECGGRILAVPNARLEDLEKSWNVTGSAGNSFKTVLCSSGEFRAYYSMRNGVYLDVTKHQRNSSVFNVNRIVYTSILFLSSVYYWQPKRFKILLDAIRNGVRGRLGEDERFPL